MKPKDVHIPNQPENKFSSIFTCDSKHTLVPETWKLSDYKKKEPNLSICIYMLFLLKSQIFAWEILIILH